MSYVIEFFRRCWWVEFIRSECLWRFHFLFTQCWLVSCFFGFCASYFSTPHPFSFLRFFIYTFYLSLVEGIDIIYNAVCILKVIYIAYNNAWILLNSSSSKFFHTINIPHLFKPFSDWDDFGTFVQLGILRLLKR